MVDIALIGVGPMAAQHARVIAAVPGLRLVSCASRNPDRARAFAAAHDISAARTVDEVKAQPEADALWLCASADAMAGTATDFAGLGLPMFLEKPVGLGLKETEAARDAIRVPHMVGLNRRFYGVIRRGHKRMAERGGVRAIEVHMPEDLSQAPEKHGARTRQQWQFANSVHLIDMFRVFAGEPDQVTVMNHVTNDADRSHNALIEFKDGARGIYNAQWYAPGGWRVALYGDGISVVYQPIEQAMILTHGRQPEILQPEGFDAKFKAGLYGQAEAFASLATDGHLPDGAADLKDYARSVTLIEALTVS